MADKDYSFGTLSDPPLDQDNRAHYRLTARARAVLELETGLPEEAVTETKRLVCGIRDISASGLCLFSEEPVSPEALLPTSVYLGNHCEPFNLMVEAVWCRPHETSFLVGVRIIESDETAYVEWVEAVAAAMAQD
ncbi:PilZ domain-containing protein [Marinobacter sp. F3R08]|uniref:PilZ domain-containing protein n=1 Tax=Marinobacter sp. F3R08 TaxID=2841559 RepID=UPI001C08275F|nr:PilZ domain-containing protein [Marinobacter sp. F3R08]MBU2955701.1 PilZ domain-containing protein [Marinobacter sp. F3R08]